jgi:hypothetical protein
VSKIEARELISAKNQKSLPLTKQLIQLVAADGFEPPTKGL